MMDSQYVKDLEESNEKLQNQLSKSLEKLSIFEDCITFYAHIKDNNLYKEIQLTMMISIFADFQNIHKLPNNVRVKKGSSFEVFTIASASNQANAKKKFKRYDVWYKNEFTERTTITDDTEIILYMMKMCGYENFPYEVT